MKIIEEDSLITTIEKLRDIRAMKAKIKQSRTKKRKVEKREQWDLEKLSNEKFDEDFIKNFRRNTSISF